MNFKKAIKKLIRNNTYGSIINRQNSETEAMQNL